MGVFLGIWPLWLVLEIVLLVLRAKPRPSSEVVFRRVELGELTPEQAAELLLPPPKTISMVAKSWRITTVVYLWAGCAAHWWWNGPTPTTVPGGILFWLIPVGLLVGDILEWKRPDGFRPWYRNPLLWLVLGALAGRFLFPQPG